MAAESETPKTPLHFDADGRVVGDQLDAADVAPHVVSEVVSGLLAGDNSPPSPSLDLYLNPPPPTDAGPQAPVVVPDTTPSGGVPSTPDGAIIQRIADPDAEVTLDIERAPDNKRLLPAAFYAKRARPIRITEITAEQVILFLEQLEVLGLWEMAAARAGLNKRVVDKIRKFDADFNEACNRAMAAYVDTTEKKITDRAIDGWDEPQWSHKTGMQLGTVRKFDSRLAELVLKRLNPAYREKFEGEVKVTGGVMVVPGRAATVEDFMKLQSMDIVEGEIVTPASDKPAPK